MSVVRKFLFEYSFDPAPPQPEPVPEADLEPEPPPPPTFSEEELEAAKAAAREEGRAEGLAEGRTAEQRTTERLAALALTQIADQMAEIAQAIAAARGEASSHAGAVALALARRLLPETARRHALDEVAGMVGACVDELRGEPRVAVRVCADLAEELREPLTRLAADRGLGAALTVVGDPALGPGDARVEWSDGSAERDETRFWADVDAAAHRILGRAAPAAAN
jgi:flagellar assembly protein FliH